MHMDLNHYLVAVVNFSHENKFENWLQFGPTFLSNVHFLSIISRRRLILMDLHVHIQFRLSSQLKPKKMVGFRNYGLLFLRTFVPSELFYTMQLLESLG